MYGSRQIEKIDRPRRFRKQAEEEVRDKQKKKQQQKQMAANRGYDMWEEEDGYARHS